MSDFGPILRWSALLLICLLIAPQFSSAQTPLASIPDSFALASDDTIQIPMEVQDVQGVTSGQFILTFSNDLIASISNVSTTNLTQNFFVFFNNAYQESLRVIFSSADPLAQGTGTFLNFEVILQPTIQPGDTSPLELRSFFMFDQNGNDFVTPVSGSLTIAEQGDIDDDGHISVTDLLRLVAFMNGSGAPPTPEELWAGDLNGDGDITQADIQIMITLVLNL